MTGTLTELTLAAALFVGAHFVLSTISLRQALRARIGVNAYLGVYSLVALATFVWLLWAYGRAPQLTLWASAPWTRWVPTVVMPFALILLIGGYSSRSPLIVGMQSAYDDLELAPRLLKVTRHPIMWATALWALSHIVANGDAASMILFGALTLLALGGAAHSERRHRALYGVKWERFAEATSYFPFAAILAGRTRLRFSDLGWGRLLLAIGLFFALLILHAPVIGVPAWPV